MKQLLTILLIVAVVGAASLAPAAVYYIGAGGNDANSGLDADQQWLTIEKAMETVAAGDTVWVKSDKTYTDQDDATGAIGEIITAGTAKALISFIGYNSTTGTVATGNGDGTFACVVLDCTSNSLTTCIVSTVGNECYSLSNFRFTGASDNCIPNGGMAMSRLYNCRFDNAGAVGLFGNSYGWIERCQFDNNTGVGVGSLSQCMVLDSVSFANGGNGIGLSSTASAFGCIAYDNAGYQIDGASYSDTIKNCTVDGGGSSKGVRMYAYLGTVQNCIITSCTVGATGADAAQVFHNTSYNNLFFDNTTDRENWPVGLNDISADPLFVDAANNDYRLSSGSPAISAGIDVGVIDGITSTSYTDIGAMQAAQYIERVLDLTNYTWLGPEIGGSSGGGWLIEGGLAQ